MRSNEEHPSPNETKNATEISLGIITSPSPARDALKSTLIAISDSLLTSSSISISLQNSCFIVIPSEMGWSVSLLHWDLFVCLYCTVQKLGRASVAKLVRQFHCSDPIPSSAFLEFIIQGIVEAKRLLVRHKYRAPAYSAQSRMQRHMKFVSTSCAFTTTRNPQV